MKLRWVCLLALLGGLSPTLPAMASDGNELYAVGAIQKSIGGAGVASAQDATWALLNPAAITQLEARADLSMEMFFLHVESEPKGFPLVSNPFAGQMEIDAALPIPSGGVIVPLKVGTLGFGMFGMQGNAADFPHPRTTLSLLGNQDRRSSYQVARIPLSYGYSFENGWSVGASVVPVATRFNTDSITLKLRPTEGDAMWRYAFGIGFQLGVVKEWEKWSLGACYSSRIWVQDYATYEQDLVTTNLDLPQKFQVGLAWRPAKRWEIVADWKWTEWSATPLFGSRTIDGGLGWRDQHSYKLGVIWDINERWTLRAGAAYGRSPIRDQYVFANAISPALADSHVAAGVSHRFGKKHELHLSVDHVLPESAVENGKGDIFSNLTRGTRTAYGEDSVTLQYTYRF